MKKPILCILFVWLYLTSTAGIHLASAQEKALSFLHNHQLEIQQLATELQVDLTASIAIAAPELLRYQMFRDFLETKALEQWYVAGGSKFADFSIGAFQMKPSFIEKLEDHILEIPNLLQHFEALVYYSSSSIKEQRSERLGRMKQIDFQLKYLYCFEKVMEDCFDGLTFETAEEQFRFFATAYNFGFDRPFADIEKWQTVAAFPYGQKIKIKQTPYESCAVELYQLMQVEKYFSPLCSS